MNNMIQNWPDALRCGEEPTAGAVFFLHGAYNVSGSLAFYSQVYKPSYRYVTFNTDGSYNATAGDSITSTSGCVHKDITALYNEGRAYNFVSSEIQSNSCATSMIANWPDAIRCGEGPTPGAIFILHGASSSTGQISWYSQVYSLYYRYVNFNADGSYNAAGGDSTTSFAGCEDKTIAELYSEGRAFNFVTSKVQATCPVTMIPNWPDAIRCSPGPDSGSVFMLSSANNTLGSNSTYVQVYAPDYRYVTFNLNGTFNSRGGDNASSIGCDLMSISDLYSEGRAFNFVTSKLQGDQKSSHASSCTANLLTDKSLGTYDKDTQGLYSLSSEIVVSKNLPIVTIIGAKGQDNFVYSNTDKDLVIVNFEPGDKLDLSILGIHNMSQIAQKADGYSTKISAGGDGEVMLVGVDYELDDSSFVFSDPV